VLAQARRARSGESLFA